MTVEDLAKAAALLAGLCAFAVLRRGRSARGQSVTAQVGDETFVGVYRVQGGQVHVSCEAGSKSAPLGNMAPAQVAERLLADLHQ